MGHVRKSKQVLEETFQTGAAILTNMAGQRERLKVCFWTPMHTVVWQRNLPSLSLPRVSSRLTGWTSLHLRWVTAQPM